MGERRTGPGLSLAAPAAGGVVLGHWLAYRLALPQVATRRGVLSAAGHPYWPLAVKAAVVLGLLGAGAVVARSLRAPLERSAPVHRSFLRLALWLSALQVAGFLTMEVGERVAAGAPLAGVLSHHVLAVGLAAQCVVAGLGALLMLLLARGTVLLALALRSAPPPHADGRWALPGAVEHRPVPLLRGSGGLRGPPPRLRTLSHA